MIWYRRHAWCPFCGATRMLRIVQNWMILIVIVEKRPFYPPLDPWSNCKGNRPPSFSKPGRRRKRSRKRHSRHNHTL